MDTLQYSVVNYSTKETAAAMRKALKARWPGTKFSVTMARGSAHGWLDVSYTDGPLDDEVRALCAGFESSRFDGMDDSYHSIPSTLYAAADGSVVDHKYSCCGVLVQRSYSPEAQAWAEGVAVRGSRWWPHGVEPWRDNEYYSSRALLSTSDLTNGTEGVDLS